MADRVPADFPLPIVLGIDPGTRALGYGAVVLASRETRLLASGVLRPPPKAPVHARLAWLRAELDDLLIRLRPAAVVVEEAFAARNVQSALRIGEGRGVVLACASGFGAEVVQYAPAVAKKALVGNGGADKSQVAWMVTQVLGLEEVPACQDTTDALALALAYVQRSRLEGTLARAAPPPRARSEKQP